MISWELLVLISVAALGGVASILWGVGRLHRPGVIKVLVTVAILGVCAGWLAATTRPVPEATSKQRQAEFTAAEYIPRQAEYDGHVSSDACLSCHPQQHKSWHDSYHRTMTQVVSSKTVVAPFDNKPLRFETKDRVEGREGLAAKEYRFFKEGDSHFMQFTYHRSDGQVFVREPMQIVMSTGSHHYQVYWVADPDGKRTQPVEVLLYWSIDHQRWIPKKDTVMIPPDKREDSGNWNSHCIRCHSVTGVPGYLPGYDPPMTEQFISKVAEFGISCEACHGAGKEHVEWHRNPLNRYRDYLGADDKKGQGDPTIVNPARCTTEQSSQICGRCHGNFWQDMERYAEKGFRYRPGLDLAEEALFHHLNHHPKTERDYVEGVYWPDNTCRTGGDEFNAHMMSPCYQRGDMTCLSCHSMHQSDPNDQLGRGMEGNQACLQCHEDFADRVESHTHHGANSAGSLCYNCHMPHTTWALSTAMRSHRIDNPRIEPSSTTGRPNACNLCHLDQTLKWSADKMAQWYGTPVAEFSSDDQQYAASVAWLLKGNAMQRAITAWHMGWAPAQEAAGKDWQAPLLAQLLDDHYSQVRFVAGDALSRIPGFEEFDYDFIAAPAQRRADANSAVKRWLGQDHPPSSARADVLVDPDGKLNLEIITRLVRERDNGRVTIPE